MRLTILVATQSATPRKSAGDDHEPDHDSGGLHHLATVRPLYPLQLAPASLQEARSAGRGDEPADAAGCMPLGVASAAAHHGAARRDRPPPDDHSPPRPPPLTGRRAVVVRQRRFAASRAASRGCSTSTVRRPASTPRAVAQSRQRSMRRDPLARLAVRRVAPAPAAVLPQLQPLGVVPLALIRLVVPALALLAGEGGSDPDVSTGHTRAF